MAAAQTFYQDPNRPMPVVGQNQGQPDPMYHSEFAATQYGDSPHPVFDGSSMPRDAALQVFLDKMDARIGEIQDMFRKLMAHAKSVESQLIPSDLKAQLERIGDGLTQRNRLESLEDKIERVAEWVSQIAKKVTDLYKMMTEMNMPRRS